MAYKKLHVWAPECPFDLLPTTQFPCGSATSVSCNVAFFSKGLSPFFPLPGMFCLRCLDDIALLAIQVSTQKLLLQRGFLSLSYVN